MDNKKEYVLTDKGKFFYKEEELYHGRKKINVEVSKDNLLIFNSILEKTNICYGLFFGTLLGAIRDKSLISYDEDVDIYALEEDRNDLFNLLFDFRENGLELVRVGKDYISLMRNNDYIDVCFFNQRKRFLLPNHRTFSNQRIKVKEKYLLNPEKHFFLDTYFNVPKNSEKILKSLYGRNWRIPIEDHYALNNTLRHKMFLKLKTCLNSVGLWAPLRFCWRFIQNKKN